MKNKSFELWYVDPFAGTGSRHSTRQVGGLLEQQPVSMEEIVLDGSARRALSVKPHFQHLVLIDARPTHFKALCALAAEFPDRDIRVWKGDANDKIGEIFSRPPWVAGSRGASLQRALVFLDPYGINVRWHTLQLLAESRRADVWYLVNLKGVVQQLARDHGGLDASKRKSLSEFFGTQEWEERFYAFQESQGDMFSSEAVRHGSRSATREEVAAFYKSRLQTLFCYVSEPLGLKVNNQDDYFQLYCMSNNSSPPATALIRKGVESVLRKYRKASRHKSDR